MIIIGCDVHTRFQQIAMLDPTTGEIIERCLEHDSGVAERFYAALSSPARVGIEATINTQWFERVLGRYGHELWIGDAPEIRASRVGKQKTAERDLRHLLRYRHKLVRYRTSVMNQLHGLAISQGLCRKTKLWRRTARQELEALVLDPWASRRRQASSTTRPAQSMDR